MKLKARSAILLLGLLVLAGVLVGYTSRTEAPDSLRESEPLVSTVTDSSTKSLIENHPLCAEESLYGYKYYVSPGNESVCYGRNLLTDADSKTLIPLELAAGLTVGGYVVELDQESSLGRAKMGTNAAYDKDHFYLNGEAVFSVHDGTFFIEKNAANAKKRIFILNQSYIVTPTGLVGATLTLGDMRTYRDAAVGISFDYPTSWGAISVENERGTCTQNYSADTCDFKMLLFRDIAHAGVFLAAETRGHHDYPVGRGSFWGDVAGGLTPEYLAECLKEANCKVVKNKNGVSFAVYEADPPPEEMGYYPQRYYIYNPNSQYYGLVLSSHRLESDVTENGKLFKDVIIESFSFLK